MVTSIRDDRTARGTGEDDRAGKKTFVEVGLALAEIRDLRLYKREYSGFEEYCQKKWGWTKQLRLPADRGGAEVAKALPDKVSHSGH